jgi:hypothetical protein
MDVLEDDEGAGAGASKYNAPRRRRERARPRTSRWRETWMRRWSDDVAAAGSATKSTKRRRGWAGCWSRNDVGGINMPMMAPKGQGKV